MNVVPGVVLNRFSKDCDTADSALPNNIHTILTYTLDVLSRPKPETPNPKPEARSPKPETRSPKPQILKTLKASLTPSTLNPNARL